jgi:hypothetical protein
MNKKDIMDIFDNKPLNKNKNNENNEIIENTIVDNDINKFED